MLVGHLHRVHIPKQRWKQLCPNHIKVGIKCPSWNIKTCLLSYQSWSLRRIRSPALLVRLPLVKHHASNSHSFMKGSITVQKQRGRSLIPGHTHGCHGLCKAGTSLKLVQNSGPQWQKENTLDSWRTSPLRLSSVTPRLKTRSNR